MWYSEVPPPLSGGPSPMSKIFLTFYIQTFNLKAGALGLFTEVCMVCGVLVHTCSRHASQSPSRPTEHSLGSLSHKYLQLFCFKPAHVNTFTDSPASPSLSNLKSFARNKRFQQHLLLSAGYAPCRSPVPSLGLVSIVRST